VTRVYDWYDANGNFIGRHGVTWWFSHPDKTKNQWGVLPTDEVHPHYHFLALVAPSYFSGSSYVTQKRWSEMWSQSLRVDYPTVVHIKTLKTKTGQPLLPDPDQVLNSDRIDQVKDPTGIFTAICETMKYTVKEQDLVGQFCKDDQANSQWLRSLTEQLYKMRRIEFGGILKEFAKGITDQESSNENLIKGGDTQEATMKVERTFVARWSNAIQKYVTLTISDDNTLDE
jgi:plasmid rolling circle replication initiator protein Rep